MCEYTQHIENLREEEQTMAVKTVNSAALDIANVTAVTGALASQKVTQNTQSFGDVLNKTTNKTTIADTSKQSYQNNTKTDTQSTVKSDNKSDNITDSSKPSDSKPDVEDTSKTYNADDAKAAADEKSVEATDAEDDMTVEQIVTALEQIISQIKDILGITDDVFLENMENLNMQMADLLNPDNMVQLVTALSGEDSAISLVANEELYSALQDITQTVETQVGTLLEDTGLSQEDISDILQKLQQANQEENIGDLNAGELNAQDADKTALVSNEAVDDTTFQTMETAVAVNEPVVEINDKTSDKTEVSKDDTAKVQTDQSNPEEEAEITTDTSSKSQTSKAEADSHENSDTKEFGHNQSTSQSFDNNLNELVNDIGETVESYTSESTESIMRQLADTVKIVKNENLTEMELQLHPASLGTVNVSLTTKGGVVTAQFTTQNEAVRAAIEAQASQLKTNLEEQGVKIEAIEVSVESHGLERNLDKNNDQQRQQSEEQEQRVQGLRRTNINLRQFEDGDEIAEEMQGADDATRIAMEMMTANGNSMDLLA
jgi:flagellar hook-length control protein FliK